MRKVHIDNILPGSILAKEVFTTEGRILLTSGMEFKDNFKEKLISNGIYEIFLVDQYSENIEIPEIVQQETIQEAKMLIKEMMNKQNVILAVNSNKIKEMVNKLLEEILLNKDIIINLSQIRSVDDYTFEHCVNVCILSLIIGIGIGYNKSRLQDLGVGSILHDIGKIRISKEILKKPSSLSHDEFEEIKKHTSYGYEILKNIEGISMISASIAFGHHERYDGSGYPLQLRNENIHQCARIVAIADVYDALTSDRVYRKKLNPHEVIEYISSLGTKHFDQQIVDVFIKSIAYYPTGSGVVLNTNECGLVSNINKKYPLRPIVRIVQDENGKTLLKHKEIDLSKNTNIYIVEVWDL